MDDKIKQVLANIDGMSKESQNKYLLLYHIVSINTMIINLINQASLSGIDLKDLNISNMSTLNLLLPTKNVPVLPLFKVDGDLIKSIVEVCADDEIYMGIINEHIKRF